MRIKYFLLILAVISIESTCFGEIRIQPHSLALSLEKRLDRFEKHKSFIILGEPLFSPLLLRRFYEKRDYELAWIKSNGHRPDSSDLMAALTQAYREGLRPHDYHLDIIEELNQEYREIFEAGHTPPASLMINLELLYTDSFLTYGSHLLAGRINPTAIDETWIANRRAANLEDVLEEAFQQGNVKGLLRELFPSQPLYKRMRQALARYSTFQRNENWPILEPGPPLQKGDQDPRVITLRKRLHLEGDFNQRLTLSEFFDRNLEKALKRFQSRYGIEADGVLGPTTIEAINVPIDDRVNALRINLERCRWFPDDLGDRRIEVNTADYHLDVIEGNKSVLSMKIIVGRQYRETPVFSSTISYLVMNPVWNVPQKIARLDILPKIQEDPEYIKNMKFSILEGLNGEGGEVSPNTIDWKYVDPENFNYHLKQQAGPRNALGRIKFIFPNKFDVYLHDTPSKNLFQRQARGFSSGCVRIEKPIELAEYLLQNDSKWSVEAIENALKKQHEIYVNVPEPLPIHIMYWTAWVDRRGRVQFRKDIYGRDTPLLEALDREMVIYEEGEAVNN